jgi:hypothetical protein
MSKNRKHALPLGQTRPVIAGVRAYIEPIMAARKERRTRTEAEKQAAMIERLIKLLGGTKSQGWPWPGHALIWDVETHGFEHKARYGAYELIGTPVAQLKAMIEAGFSDEEMRSAIRRSVERGLFYDSDRCQPAEIETMRRFVDECNLPLRLRPLQEFKDEVFYGRHDGERKGLNMPTLLVGHNSPFDFGAIAIHSYPSRGRDFGALACVIDNNQPTISIKTIGFGKHMFTQVPRRTDGARRRFGRATPHRFLDTMQFGRALRGAGCPSSLEAMAPAFGVPNWEKGEIDYDAPISPDALRYVLNDVEGTKQLFFAQCDLYRQYGLPRPIDRLFSEASDGKALLDQMGYLPFNQKNPDFDRRILGLFMGSMFGGLADVNWKHEIVEVQTKDFKSQYTTVGDGLMRLGELLAAKSVAPVVGGPLDEDARLLTSGTDAELIARLQNPDWRWLRGVVVCDPTGCFLPVRASYAPPAIGHNGGPDLPDAVSPAHEMNAVTMNIGVNKIVSAPLYVCTYLDFIAARLEGRAPVIKQTIRLEPSRDVQGNLIRQEGLKPVDVLGAAAQFGEESFKIDPNVDDQPFVKLIDVRGYVKNHPDFEANKKQWKPTEQGLKTMASATAYGILIEMIKLELKRDEIDKLRVSFMGEVFELEPKSAQALKNGDPDAFGVKAEKPGC